MARELGGSRRRDASAWWDWRIHYNTARPHSALGYRPPAAWLATWAASLELREGSAQLPLRPVIETENSQTTWS